MKGLLQARRFRIFTAVVVTICFLALLAPHAGSHGTFIACVLFFPVFLFGLLDLPWLLRGSVGADETIPPFEPVATALFQRPPPSFD
jgi:hypothetical protein